MKRSVVALSNSLKPENAFETVSQQILESCDSPLLIIFFSDCNNFYFYTNKFKEIFPSSTVMGSTTYSNFCSQGFSHNGLAAMAIIDGIEVSSGLLFEISKFPRHYIQHVYNALNGISSFENTCCLEFSTAFSTGEELVLDTFEEAFGEKSIPVIGGTSGCAFSEGKKTVVSLNGVCYVDTCVFVMIHNLEGQIHIFLENWYKPTNKVLSITDIDVDNRRIYAFDDKNASLALSEALNVPVSSLKDSMVSNPLGRIRKDRIMITGLDKIFPDGSVSFLTQIYNHSHFAIMERDNLDEVWQRSKNETFKKIKKTSFGICINCLSNILLLEKENKMDGFSDFLKNNYGDYIGLSGYGEQLGFNHMNQTMLMVLFE